MASSSLRFFSATRVIVGQRRFRSAIHASTSSGVSRRTLVPMMGIGFLRKWMAREERDKKKR
jgi:sorbitol-specific phosphotransferase system component IIC